MPVPAQVRTQILNRLDTAWDALQDGTLFQRDFVHDSIQMDVGGRSYIIQIGSSGHENYAQIMLMVKRKPQ